MIPQIILCLVLILLARLSGFNNHILAGVSIYLMISYILRFQIPKHHRKGVSLYRKKLFKEAIPQFQKSYGFFNKNRWIDRFRFITLMSSSRVSYTEMALLNMAFCYGQIGDGKKSKELYKKVLKEFPDSEMAKASLRMYDASASSTEQQLWEGRVLRWRSTRVPQAWR